MLKWLKRLFSCSENVYFYLVLIMLPYQFLIQKSFPLSRTLVLDNIAKKFIIILFEFSFGCSLYFYHLYETNGWFYQSLGELNFALSVVNVIQ